jgi:uncharacterized membrane protein YbhN (UPF0104 family)
VGDDLGDRDLAAVWEALDRLHAAGITHGALEPDRIRVDGTTVHLSDLSSAEVAPEPSDVLVDQAQLLVSTAVISGVGRAVAAAEQALGTEGLTAASSYVQPAALNPALRRQVAAADLDVDAVRRAAVAAAGAEEPPLQRLRRLSVGRVLMGLLLFVAATALISGLTNIGIDNIIDAIAAASVPILIVAFVIGQTPRFANAVALSAASPVRVPFGRLVALQFAQCFVALAMPSTAGRVAVNIRFFQRNGVGSTEAVTIGAVDGFTGFLGQVLLLVTILLLGLGTLEFHLDESFSLDADGRLLFWLLMAVVVVVAVVLLVPRLRHLVVATVRRVWGLVGPLVRSPRRVVVMIGANLMSELLFSLCTYTTLRAFGQSVSFADAVVVTVCVSLFAGLMPVPGGIGVSEAALTAGFIAMGVPDATAFAAAITYRMLTFYIPPLLGVVAFRWLQRQRFL